MKKSNFIKILGFLTLVLLFTACANRVDVTPCIQNLAESPAGFWGGLWNGMTAVISSIGQLCSNNISVYNLNNNGTPYNFGFFVGIGGFGYLMKLVLGFIKTILVGSK